MCSHIFCVDICILFLMQICWLLSEDNKKCLDIETACVLLQLVLGVQYQAQVDSFIKFLKVSGDYHMIAVSNISVHKYELHLIIPFLPNWLFSEWEICFAFRVKASTR